jgi:hypothetical protein
VDEGLCSRRVPLLLARPQPPLLVLCVLCLVHLRCLLPLCPSPPIRVPEVRSESCGDRWSERAPSNLPQLLVPPVFGGSANRRAAHVLVELVNCSPDAVSAFNSRLPGPSGLTPTPNSSTEGDRRLQLQLHLHLHLQLHSADRAGTAATGASASTSSAARPSTDHTLASHTRTRPLIRLPT